MSKSLSLRFLYRALSQNVQGTSQAKTGVNADVPGLSQKVIRKPNGNVGPAVDPSKKGEYKVPEYYCYNNMSYFHAEVEMVKHRLPQPSALRN